MAKHKYTVLISCFVVIEKCDRDYRDNKLERKLRKLADKFGLTFDFQGTGLGSNDYYSEGNNKKNARAFAKAVNELKGEDCQAVLANYQLTDVWSSVTNDTTTEGKVMKKLNYAELETLLETRNRTEPVVIVLRTTEFMNTGGRKDKVTGEYPNRFHGRICRIAEQSVFLGADYENSVNNQRERELQPLTMDGKLEHFHAEKPTWAERITVNGRVSKFFVTCASKPDSRYLAYKPNQDKDGNFRTYREEYRWNEINGGKLLTDVELAEAKTFFKPKGESQKQEVDRIVPWRNLEVGGLLQIRMGGEIYTLDIEPTTVVGSNSAA